MKRGNTALKRGVGLASAFALAIAGAVIAAPAANAATFPAATIAKAGISVRTQPVADAALVAPTTGAVITTAAQYTTNAAMNAGAGAKYGDVPTGQAVNVGVGSSQAASTIQVLVSANYVADSVFQLQLDNDATWASANVSVATAAVTVASLNTNAGYSNTAKVLGVTQATVGAAGAGSAASSATKTDINSDGDILAVTLKGAATSLVAGTDGILITISGIKINVPASATADAVTATLVGVDGDSNSTTIAYVTPYELVKAADAGYTVTAKSTGNLANLPAVTVRETSNPAFANSTAYTAEADGDAADPSGTPAVALDSTVTPKAKPSSKLNVGSGPGVEANTADGVTLATITTANSDLRESFTTTGLVVKNLKAGADVTLSLTGPLASSGDTTSSWAHTAGQQDLGVSLKISKTDSEPRIAGKNRNDTAAQIAKKLVDEGEGTAVVLANGTDIKGGADALSANFLAGAKDAPILLTTDAATLPTETADALKYLFDDTAGSNNEVTIYVLGGTDSVSQAAADQAESIVKAAVNAAVSKVTVKRIAGKNRYETSAAVAVEAGKDAIVEHKIGTGSDLKTAFLASGAVNADALAAAGISAGAGIPVLLADGDTANDKVADAISSLGIKQLIVLGGTDRVSDKLVDALKADHGVTSVKRIAGVGAYGRYNTATLLNEFAFSSSAGLNLPIASATAYLANAASGKNSGFADALAVGPLAGSTSAGTFNAAVFTVPGNLLTDLTKQYLTTNSSDFVDVTALGQSDRIASSVITAAQSAIGIN